MTWDEYLKNTKNIKPRPLLVEALSYIAKTDNNHALDFGAGALNDTRFLIESGYKVVIVDSNPAIANLATDFPQDQIELHIVRFEEYVFPIAAFTLINAQYALPFILPGYFEKVWKDLVNSLSPEGIFTGQFFGIEDEWASLPGMNFHAPQSIQALFGDEWLIHKFEEEKAIRPTAAGKSKFWHVFHVIAEKK